MHATARAHSLVSTIGSLGLSWSQSAALEGRQEPALCAVVVAVHVEHGLHTLSTANCGRQDDEAELLAELERIKAERAEEAAKLAAERAAEEEQKVRHAAHSAVPPASRWICCSEEQLWEPGA